MVLFKIIVSFVRLALRSSNLYSYKSFDIKQRHEENLKMREFYPNTIKFMKKD